MVDVKFQGSKAKGFYMILTKEAYKALLHSSLSII